MRKLLLLFVVLVLLVPPLGTFAQDDEPITLRVSGFERNIEAEEGTMIEDVRYEIMDDFMTDHPTVTLDSIETPPDFETQLLVDLAAGTAPDLWYQDASTLDRLVDMDSILDMRECVDLVPELTFDRFVPTFLAIHERDDGAVYGLPDGGTPMVVYYNPEAFDRAGVDYPEDGWTWDDLVETAKLLTLDAEGRNRNDPDFDEENVVQWGYRVRQWTYEWIFKTWQNGSDVLSPDGTTASDYLDSPESKEAIQFLADMILVHKVAPPLDTYSQMTTATGSFHTLFLQGEIAMFDSGQWEMSRIPYHVDFTPERVAVVGQPQNAERATVIYESGWVINSALKDDPAKLLAACQFAEVLTSRRYQDLKVQTGLEISANAESAAQAVEESEFPEMEAVFVEQAQYGRRPYGAIYSYWPTVEEIINSMMESILLGGDLDDEVELATDEINRELDRAIDE